MFWQTRLSSTQRQFCRSKKIKIKKTRKGSQNDKRTKP